MIGMYSHLTDNFLGHLLRSFFNQPDVLSEKMGYIPQSPVLSERLKHNFGLPKMGVPLDYPFSIGIFHYEAINHPAIGVAASWETSNSTCLGMFFPCNGCTPWCQCPSGTAGPVLQDHLLFGEARAGAGEGGTGTELFHFWLCH